MPAYERLSFLDNTFLVMEGPTNAMHVGATLVFEPGDSLRGDKGGVDIERVRTLIGSRLQYVPRYRQRLKWIPVERHPVWVDDAHFDIAYHVRHAALPQPGDSAQLREMAGRFLSQRLESSRPLWEVLVVEGLEGDRVALVTKVHHCMIDGIGGVDLLKVVLSPAPSSDLGVVDEYQPRPVPSSAELLRDEISRRARIPLEAVRSVRRFAEETKEMRDELRQRLLAMTHSARSGWFVNASPTPLNRKIGPNRRIAYLESDLQRVKEIKNSLGGTVNDAVIAAVAGGIRSFLIGERDFDVEGIDFRAMVPVSVRDDAGAGEMGNHITMWLVDLPIAEPDPVARFEAVAAATEHLKTTDQALGAALLTQSASFTPSTVLSVAARVAAAAARPFNVTITNVPGPQVPLYMAESRLENIYPMVPLWVNHGVGVALFSYDGRLDWGFAGDWDSVPDLDRFVELVADSLDELHAAAK